MQQVAQLVKMVNQIADNFRREDDPIERTAAHLRRFWAPSMRRSLVEFESADGTGLNDAARAAVRHLAAG
jgi:formate dehydrogenase subunit delta